MGRRLESLAPLSVPRPRVAPDLVERVVRPRVIGYAPGAFDLFHVGHLNLLRRASAGCDRLIAGVVSDEILLQQKGRFPVVPQAERLEIVAGMSCVDQVYLERNRDKVVSWSSLRFSVLFKGDDWQGTREGLRLEHAFAEVGVRIVYLPYTDHTSTTRLRQLVAARGVL